MTGRRWARTLAAVLCLPLSACGGDEDLDLEPGPATEGVPGAAGSITPGQWDTDLDDRVDRDEFPGWWREQAPTEDRQPGASGGEADAALPEDEGLDAWFDRLDVDGDGSLDAAERAALRDTAPR